jgi:hypothetical protein
VPSSLICVPYLLVSLGGVLGGILGKCNYNCSCCNYNCCSSLLFFFCGFGTLFLVRYLWINMCSLGYLLVLVFLLESFYIEKVMVLKGGCVPMVG